jgi:general secretion pathway protein B
MSSILDALKKSERQRSLGRDLVFRNASPAATPRLGGLTRAVLVALLLLAVALAVQLFSVRETVPPLPAVTTPAETRIAPPDSGTSAAQRISRTTAVPASVAPTETAQALPATGTGEAAWLNSFPEAFRSGLPPLTINIHVYSPDESRRILYINNRQTRQGEQVEGGVVVEEIVHDGVVLQFRGQRFKLPRPS